MTPDASAAPTHPGGVTIAIEDEPAERVRAVVLAGLVAHNRRHAEAPDFAPLVLAARDASGSVVGGLVGQTGWRWLHVELLWVDESHRGGGIGESLLRAAERAAAARGCRHVDLDTFDFHARPFYERLGYTVFGVQDDYPPGHRRYYLRRTIAADAGAEASNAGASSGSWEAPWDSTPGSA